MDEGLLTAMDAVTSLVEQGHAARQLAKVKVRQPLGEIRLVAEEASLPAQVEPLLPLLADELNVKRAVFVDSVDELYDLSVRLDGKLAKPKYKRHFNAVLQAVQAMDVRQLEAQLKDAEAISVTADGETFEVAAEEILIDRRPAEGWSLAEGNGFAVALDIELDEALLREGQVRDLVRKIQDLRKKSGFEVDDRIRIAYATDDELAAAIDEHASYVAGETLAVGLKRGETTEDEGTTVKLGGHTVELALTKAS